jgi:hypothetical protein
MIAFYNKDSILTFKLSDIMEKRIELKEKKALAEIEKDYYILRDGVDKFRI